MVNTINNVSEDNNVSSTATVISESVVVVMDASSRSSDITGRGNTDAIEWALKNVARPRDTVLVLGVLCESFGSFNHNNKNKSVNSASCFPLQFLMGIGISGIWERLEFGGHGELNAREVEEEFQEKRVQYQTSLQQFYRQCKKMEVKLDVKLSAGFPARKLIVDEAQNSNARWIVLNSHFKKDKDYISGHVNCNLALIKRKDVATLFPSKGSFGMNCQVEDFPTAEFDKDLSELSSTPTQSPCWYPLSWRNEFPRAFPQEEIKAITKGFSEDNVAGVENDTTFYQGMLQETPVLVQCFKESSDKSFWSMLKILTHIRHRNVANVVGYCCTKDSLSILFDYPCMGTVAMNLQCDQVAQNLGWKSRWCIAQEIGACLRYLHEECIGGPIVHNSVCSSHVVFSRFFSAMLSNFTTSEWLKNDDPAGLNEDSEVEGLNREKGERLIADVHGYGLFLLELVSGKSASQFLAEGHGQNLVDWGLPLLENGLVWQVMDSRLKESGDDDDTWMAHHMAHAALHCLQNDSTHNLSISEAIGIVRGHTHGTCNHLFFDNHPEDSSRNK